MAATASPTPNSAVLRPGRRLRACDDAELVRCLRAGDDTAFEVIYDRHHRGILSFCRHMVGSREEAEDAVQHTFIGAHKDLVGSDKPIRLKAWLYAIARNRCLSVLRARREQVALDDVEPATEGLSVEVQRREDLRDLLGDLSRLPDDQRAALVLSELGALSHDEIAVTLDVRKEKVKALVFQARESLASSRLARDTDCHEIREQLSVLRGAALRRSAIRRHLDVCPGCRDFREEVQRQRAGMAVILPVAPTIALKGSVLAAGAAAAGGAGMSGGGGVLAVLGAQSLTAKALVTVTIAGGAAGAAVLGGKDVSKAPAERAGPAVPAQVAAHDPHEVVVTLRERAESVAAEREQDLRARARRPKRRPASSAAPERASGGPAAVVPIAAREPVRETPREAPAAVDPPRRANAPAQQADPPAVTPPAGETQVTDGARTEKATKPKRGKWKPKKRGRGHGRGRGRSDVPASVVPSGEDDDRDDDEDGRDDDDEHRDRGEQRRERDDDGGEGDHGDGWVATRIELPGLPRDLTR